MKYLKLFENYSIKKDEFPFYGNDLSKRERGILSDLVGDYYLDFRIKKDDGYYYTNLGYIYYNRFESFNDLIDYIQFHYFIDRGDTDSFINLLKTTKLDMSFDNNFCVINSSIKGYTEIVKILLEDPNVDPSSRNNHAIKYSSAAQFGRRGYPEIVKLLLEDPRVRAKLTSKEINKYSHTISKS